MSTKQLLINTNEDSDLPYKGELRIKRAAKSNTRTYQSLAASGSLVGTVTW